MLKGARPQSKTQNLPWRSGEAWIVLAQHPYNNPKRKSLEGGLRAPMRSQTNSRVATALFDIKHKFSSFKYEK